MKKLNCLKKNFCKLHMQNIRYLLWIGCFLITTSFINFLFAEQGCVRKGLTSHGASTGETFEWGGPTESTVSVVYTNRTNDSGDPHAYYRTVGHSNPMMTNLNNLGAINYNLSHVIAQNRGFYGHPSAPNYGMKATFTFERPVPVDEIFMAIYQVDERNSNGNPASGKITLTGSVNTNDFEEYEAATNSTRGWINKVRASSLITASITWQFDFTPRNCRNGCDPLRDSYIAFAGTTERLAESIEIELEDVPDPHFFILASLAPCRKDIGDLPNSYGSPLNEVSYTIGYEPQEDNSVWVGRRVNYESIDKHSNDATGDEFDDGVEDFPAIILPGESFDIDIILNSNTFNTVHYGLWINWRENGNFRVSNTGFYSGSVSTYGLARETITITAPIYLPADNNHFSYRLRVDEISFHRSDAEESRNNGETEDYQTGNVLDLALTRFSVEPVGNDVLVQWQTVEPSENVTFDIEFSLDGQGFQSIAKIKGLNNNSLNNSYEFVQMNGLTQINEIAL